jgi:hypothetical protein
MQFREQLQMTNSDLRYIYCAGNVGGQGSCSSSRYLESARIKVSAGLLEGGRRSSLHKDQAWQQ